MSRSLISTYVIVLSVFAWFVTYGTGTFFAAEWLSASYDSLGSALLRGGADIAPDAISFEALRQGDRTYMYFGPFPALLRIFFNAMSPPHFGLWARVSCFLAASISAGVFGLILTRALRLNGALEPRQRAALAGILILSFSLGTPLLYLVSCSRIFHEASLWGLAGGLAALYGILLLCTGVERPLLGRAIFSTGLAVALLSRVTFGAPICLAAPVVFLWRLGPEGRAQGSIVRTAFLRLAVMMPALLGVAIQLWYNNERFGSPFLFVTYQGFYLDPTDIGGKFNLARFPTAFRHYFGFFWGYFSHTAPYVRMISSEITEPELFMRHWREQTISLTFASCAAMLSAALGIVALVRGRAPLLLAVYACCLLSQAITLLGFFFITQRYEADFLPLLALGIAVAALTLPHSRRLVLTLGILGAVSITVTISSVLDWTMAFNQHAPNGFRRRIAEAFLPPLALPSATERVYLSDGPALKQTDSGAHMRYDTSAAGNPLFWCGTSFTKGIGMKANASALFAVPPGFSRFQAIVMPAHESTHLYDSGVSFSVINDSGDAIFRSGTMGGRSLPQVVDVALGSARTITLSLSIGSGVARGDMGNWAMASFVKALP